MVRILDTTLREGEQTPGVAFDAHIKMAIADRLNDLGIDIIEAGHPVVSPEICGGICELTSRNYSALVGAHARSIIQDVDLAVDCGVDFVGIFYCVSEERLIHYDRKLNQAIKTICDVIRYTRDKARDIIIRYTPEDTVRTVWKNVVLAASEAVRAGADVISVADTTGYMIPGTKRSMYDYICRLKDELAQQNLYPEIGVHCHNDRGLAVANAIDGFRAGADIIDVSVMGMGERAGIADLATLMVILATDFGVPATWKLDRIMPLYQLVSKYARLSMPVTAPVTGAHAFTHCAGVHTQATIHDPLFYQSLQPEPFGRRSRISLDHMSGISSVRHALEELGEEVTDRDFLQEVLKKVKRVGQGGKAVDLDELRYIVRYVKENAGRSLVNQFYRRSHEDRIFTFPDQKG